MDTAPLGPLDELGYRRPPVTVSFEDLRRRGLPEVLFVHSFLLEGVTVCDVTVFAAMIEEAYHTPGVLRMHPDLDPHGNEQCLGIGRAGTWKWTVIRPSKPINDLLYVSAWQGISRVLDHPQVELMRRQFADVAAMEKARAAPLYPVALVFSIYQWVLGGDICERVLGRDHPDTMAAWAAALSWVGDAGYPAYGRNHYEVLIHSRQRILGPGHPDTLLTRQEFARLTGLAGDPAAARDQLADLLKSTPPILISNGPVPPPPPPASPPTRAADDGQWL